MPEPGSVVVIGGTQGLGLEVARHYVKQGREVVLSGRDRQRAEAAAADLGGKASGIALDLAEPGQLADRLAGIGRVGHLVLEGEVEASFDGDTVRLGPGDVAWAGVGCVHGFSNPADRPVRWLETQAPQPPGRHSYRFTRDWDYLRDAIA